MTLSANFVSVSDEKESSILFTSLLLRYPELCSLNYYPREDLLKLVFVLSGKLPKTLLNNFTSFLETAISTYLFFAKKETLQKIEVFYECEAEFTKVIITRDIATLSLQEISLMVRLLNFHFEEFLISETEVICQDEDLVVKDDCFKTLLGEVQIGQLKNEIIALREEGRVLIFQQ